MLNRLLEIFRSIPAPLVVVVAFVLPAAETALMVGLLIPGELIAVAAGIRAASADVSLVAVLVAAALGAIAGDSLGYFVGRRFGGVLSKRISAKRRTKAQDWLKRRGLPAIFLARFTAFVRSVMPAAAGAAKIPYRSFLLWSAPAGLLWGVGSVLLGYYAARSSEHVLVWATLAGLALIGGFVLVSWLLKRKRRGRKPKAARRASAK